MYLLARYLRVNPAWLMGYDVSEEPVKEAISVKAREIRQSASIHLVEDKIQELTDILSAMKNDITFLSPSEKGLILKYRQIPTEQQVAIRATIDSMYALVQQNAPTTTANSDEGAL